MLVITTNFMVFHVNTCLRKLQVTAFNVVCPSGYDADRLLKVNMFTPSVCMFNNYLIMIARGHTHPYITFTYIQ